MLIQFADGVLLEVDAPGDQVEQLAGGLAHKVNSSLSSIESILANACRPIISSWKQLDEEMLVERAEIEMGLSFEGEGNAYITKARAGANITVRLSLSPRRQRE